MEPEDKDIIVIDQKDMVVHEPEITPLTLLNKIIDKGGDLAQIEKFMDLQERHEQRLAKKGYDLAMASFKLTEIEIGKDSTVAYFDNANNLVKYEHASLHNVLKNINPALSKNGLSISFPPSQTENGDIKVVCRITHESGYSEECSLIAPPDTSGKKGATQAIGSTMTRLQRYLALAMTGLATKGQDVELPPEEDVVTISDKQEIELTDIIESKGRTVENFCKWWNLEKLGNLLESNYSAAMKKLEEIE